MSAVVGSGAVLGVDFGLRRVGLAVSDPARSTAVAAGWIEGKSGRELARLVRSEAVKRGADCVVVGLPPEGGRDNDKVIAGAENLAAALQRAGLEVHRWDESYTTAAVLSDRKRYGGRSRRPAGWRDEAAAVLILQGFLNNLKPGGGQ